jgi:hypothetical protein
MVVVVMGDQHELDVRETHTARPQGLFERRQRHRDAWSGVDKRERLAAQQPRVDREPVPHRQLDPFIHKRAS